MCLQVYYCADQYCTKEASCLAYSFLPSGSEDSLLSHTYNTGPIRCAEWSQHFIFLLSYSAALQLMHPAFHSNTIQMEYTMILTAAGQT